MTVGNTDSRQEKLRRDYDLVIVGGGFYGACAFEEAAARGLNVLLLERGDFCSGASANSLKTVHGGIRYLQSGDIFRLRLYAKARQCWAARAPRLMRPLRCVAPLPRSLVASAPFVRIGVLGYQLLTIDRRTAPNAELALAPPSVVSRDHYKQLASPLSDHHTKHGLLWEDYQVFDSERLVMDTIRAAEGMGGRAINYVEALEIATGDSDVSAISVRNCIDDRQYLVRARSTLAFTGSAPGDSELLEHSAGKRSRPVLAINVIIGRQLVSGGVAFSPAVGRRDVPGRYLFCVPWQDSTIVGTWYWRVPESTGSAINAHRLIDLDEVLGDINDSLDGANITDEDITRIHWGWLPGNWDDVRDAEASLLKDPLIRKSAAHDKSAACAVVEGTKFTTANVVALDSLNAAGLTRKVWKEREERFMQPISPVLTGECLDDFEKQAKSMGLSSKAIDRLATQYGNAALDILDIARQQPELANPIVGEAATVQSEIVFSVLYEQAMHLSDVIFRRTGIGGCGLPAIETLQCCAEVMARCRGWDEDEVDRQIRRIMEQPCDGRWIDT